MKRCGRAVPGGARRSREEILLLGVFLLMTGFVLGMIGGGLGAGYFFARQEVNAGNGDGDDGFFINGAQINDVFQFLAQTGEMQYFHNSELDGHEYMVTGQIQDIFCPVEEIEELAFAYGLEVVVMRDTIYVFTPNQSSQRKKKIARMGERDG